MLRYEAGGGRATITIDDPERRNPLSPDVVVDMEAALRKADADPEVGVVVVTGAGDRAFSAGGDLAGGPAGGPIARHPGHAAFAELLRTLHRIGTPVVARVNGHALGGGLGVAASCDVVIAADHATFGTPEIRVGLWPMMITAVLQRVMPRRAAIEMMLTGRRLDAAEACRLGLVSRVVPAADLDAVVGETVATLASASPAVLRMGRNAFYGVADLDFDAALEYLQAALTGVTLTEDAAEGIAAFLQKRDPEWRGR